MSEASKVEKLRYTKKEAAVALAISVRSIESMLADKRLNGVRFGKRVLIPAAEVRKAAVTNDYLGNQKRSA